ncbi:MAG: hypothetical protein EA379_02955 [Phycisphaerales bacterium]|nr:MAG: hypothetical protein EA379_02955 [Phycisphaerales bacterium]
MGEAVEGGGTDDLVAMAPARVDLFGVAGEQNAMRIVYVVDASGSMLPVMPVIRAELRRSIETLDASQSFQVLAFTNGGVRTITGLSGARDGAMVRATRANKRAVASWFDTVDAGGVGDPMGALEHALRLRPDAVFLISKRLTDTAWTAEGARQRVDEALARLDTLNPRDPRSGLRPASIRVVHFYDDEPWDMLRIIGETHGGESGYVFVRRGEAWAR